MQPSVTSLCEIDKPVWNVISHLASFIQFWEWFADDTKQFGDGVECFPLAIVQRVSLLEVL